MHQHKGKAILFFVSIVFFITNLRLFRSNSPFSKMEFIWEISIIARLCLCLWSIRKWNVKTFANFLKIWYFWRLFDRKAVLEILIDSISKMCGFFESTHIFQRASDRTTRARKKRPKIDRFFLVFVFPIIDPTWLVLWRLQRWNKNFLSCFLSHSLHKNSYAAR
jgi:hypothetical protein